MASSGVRFLFLATLLGLLAWTRHGPTFTGLRQRGASSSPKALDALARRNSCRVALKAVGLFFATQTGNTEEVAGLIGSAAGLEASDYDGEDFSDLDGMIVGCPTWNTGADEERSGTTWDDYLETIKGYDLKGKVVAVFGCGDSQSYGDNFCDGIEELHETFAAAGAKMVGYSDASGYDYTESKSVKDGKFLGLPLDQDNEGDQSEDRIAAWVEQLKAEGMPF
jgi:flavodoxin I